MLDGYDLLATIGIDRDREARSRLTPRDPEWTDAAPTGSTFEGLEVLEGRTLIGEIKDGEVVEPARWIDESEALDKCPAFQRLRAQLGLT